MRLHTLLSFAAAAAALASNVVATKSSSSCTFTISPGPGALHKAQFKIREILASTNKDIIVCLSPGVFNVSETPLHFTHEDSFPTSSSVSAGGESPRVIWRGSESSLTTISGGIQLTSWQQATLGGSTVYSTATPPANSGTGAFPIRQLWVDNTRAYRTKVSAASAFGTLTGWASADGNTIGYTASAMPPSYASGAAPHIEFSWPIVIHNWIEPRCTVSNITPAGNLTLASPCGKFLRERASGSIPAPVNVEAIPLFPLLPGTFWHDVPNGLLYYALAQGQTPSDLTTNAWISNAEELVSYANNTSNHVWEDIQFTYATWFQVNSGDGYVDDQSAVYECTPGEAGCNTGNSAEPRGAVRVMNSSNIQFIGCSFMHMGSPYALSIDQGSQYATVTGCNFSDLSGGFLKLASIDSRYNGVNTSSSWDSFSSVTQNRASDMAVEIGGAAGMFVGYTFSSVIAHNDIQDAGYDGISLGWGWGSGPSLPGVGNNTIQQNLILNVMTKLRDGGGIYLNGGTSFASVVTGNVVDGDEAVFAVFYLDNGAQNWTVTQNVAYNSSLAWAFFLQGCCNLPAKSSEVDHFWWQGDLAPQNNCVAEGCVVDAASVYQVQTGNPWPAAAQSIIAAAGVQETSKEVLRKWREGGVGEGR